MVLQGGRRRKLCVAVAVAVGGLRIRITAADLGPWCQTPVRCCRSCSEKCSIVAFLISRLPGMDSPVNFRTVLPYCFSVLRFVVSCRPASSYFCFRTLFPYFVCVPYVRTMFSYCAFEFCYRTVFRIVCSYRVLVLCFRSAFPSSVSVLKCCLDPR